MFKTVLDDKSIKDNFDVNAYANYKNIRLNNILKKFDFEVLEKRKKGTLYTNKFYNFKEKLEQYISNYK